MADTAEVRQVMGNEAIALGALAAGVNLVAGYPGTPSSEIIECISRYNRETGTYVEWSVNEKAAAEVAAGASIAGSRSLITMKQVGLNVASDPLMCLSYVGVKGGMVIVSADDPGPISSQTEQDTRVFARYAKMPVFDPSSPSEAFRMVQDAFACSEQYNTPVIIRPTTRVCHAYESMAVPPLGRERERGSFVKDTARWVIFPRASFLNHKRIFERDEHILPELFSRYPLNRIERPFAAGESGSAAVPGAAPVSDLSAPATPACGRKGIACSGISYAYVREALEILRKHAAPADLPEDLLLFKVSTPYPFPEALACSFLKQAEEVLVVEELDPVVERELIYLEGKFRLDAGIHGKLNGCIAEAGENTVESVRRAIADFIGLDAGPAADDTPPLELPVRPPVLCAGCPHRASFYAVKQAMKGQKCLFAGDIGCYTLGNAMPLDMVDTCLCMGAGLGIAQGIGAVDAGTKCFAFVGDSTFFAAAIPGAVNGVYNQADMTLVVLDNSTTAMTGHQPHPGTGRTMMGEVVEKVSIEETLAGIGVRTVRTVDPLDLPRAVEAVREVAAQPGVKALIFRSPCIALVKPLGRAAVDQEKCRKCKKCIREIGCPGIVVEEGKVVIDMSQCTGCGICAEICPFDAIEVTRLPGGGEPKRAQQGKGGRA